MLLTLHSWQSNGVAKDTGFRIHDRGCDESCRVPAGRFHQRSTGARYRGGISRFAAPHMCFPAHTRLQLRRSRRLVTCRSRPRPRCHPRALPSPRAAHTQGAHLCGRGSRQGLRPPRQVRRVPAQRGLHARRPPAVWPACRKLHGVALPAMQARTTPVEGVLLPLLYFHTSTCAQGGRSVWGMARPCHATWARYCSQEVL